MGNQSKIVNTDFMPFAFSIRMCGSLCLIV